MTYGLCGNNKNFHGYQGWRNHEKKKERKKVKGKLNS